MNQADLIVTRIERARQDRSISVAELARRIDVGRIAGSPSVLFDRPQENTSGFIKRGRHADHHD